MRRHGPRRAGRLRRGWSRVLAGLLMGAALLLVTASPAAASPSGFSEAYVHAGGAGATAVRLSGGFTWYNRSVALEDITLYVASNHCASAMVLGKHNGDALKSWISRTQCAGATARTIAFGRTLFDASKVVGGINNVQVCVLDETHTKGNDCATYNR